MSLFFFIFNIRGKGVVFNGPKVPNLKKGLLSRLYFFGKICYK